MPKKKDLTGQVFGRLTVMYEIPERKNGKILWHCKCSCGNEINIIASSLTKSKNPTRSCGCLQKERTKQANTLNLIGQKFGRLTVIERKNNGWLCQCECGGTTITSTTHLKSNHTQSCGCLQRERASKASLHDCIGKTFGKLTVIARGKTVNKKVFWECLCECGRTVEVPAANLKKGDTLSCGCLKMSHGEYKIRQLLDEANIKYQTEYIFDSCRNPKTNKPLRFDFFINNEYLIEFDGIQHFQEGHGYMTKESLIERQYRDSIKEQWCKNNNIPLIRIPYTKLKTLTIEDLLLPCKN